MSQFNNNGSNGDIPPKKSGLFSRLHGLVVRKILHADDTPQRLALGIGLGLFVAWTPTIGIQMILSAAVASFFRANIPVCVMMVWLSNPLTLVPVYYPNYLVGRWVMGWFRTDHAPGYDYQQLKQVLEGAGSESIWSHLLELEFWKELFRVLVSLGVELWVGSLIVGAILGVAGYYVSRWMIVKYRSRPRWQERHGMDIQSPN